MLGPLKERELLQEIRKAPVSLDALTFDECGEELAILQRGDESGFGFGAGLWDRLKYQFRQLICGQDPKDADLRAQLQIACKQGSGVLIAWLSATLGPKVGIEAAIAGPFVAILLLATARMGVRAICSDEPLNSVVEKVGDS